ncbi:NAD(P)/FAD-dependent oxidoreductase [Nitrincola tapanii]|uniref:FAD-binding protein n=1 Tax=Nitrincola tapanii TaxID=1708751 RepID=A0A5A9VZP4_9GAMM|nr:FAD-dependent oxidoreductase [Nitrincola tapanii]KAA0873967.1 FAD-binding protein [Nitrincola tapanii]
MTIINKELPVAVIGAGIAGLRCALGLREAGFAVEVFDKSRGTGGRLASTRVGALSADLGAPWIMTEDAEWRDWLNRHPHAAVPWTPWRSDFSLFNPAQTLSGWVGVPRSSAITRALAQGVTLTPERRISVVWPEREGVLLRDEQGEPLGHYAAAMVATPAPQAAPLLDAVQRFRQRAESVLMQPSWVLVLSLTRTPTALQGIDWVEGEHPVFRRWVRDSSKPGRQGEVWVLEASDAWSQDYVNLNADSVAQELMAEFEALVAEPLSVEAFKVHRWLYSAPQKALEAGALWDADARIGACGDWLGGSSSLSSHAASYLESAWCSGRALAEQVMTRQALKRESVA